jgi:hypothetical protein
VGFGRDVGEGRHRRTRRQGSTRGRDGVSLWMELARVNANELCSLARDQINLPAWLGLVFSSRANVDRLSE